MSSNDIAIRVENLEKCFQIYAKPSDRLKQFLAPRLKWLTRSAREKYHRDFWALRDISFEVKRGDTVGMVGRNGSGKSTLLQIICGTLSPTHGSVQVNGRVAALLELGAGFNPEFSGRENVYMNAALYGLTREQTDARFDAIAAFADIGEFIEEPVKTYSSGMYVRLAFAVIAHVDADILIIDEALSVGDAVFTQKCMRFIRKFQENGTLLFVSHDMGAIQNLCASAMWLNKGRLISKAASKTVVEQYTHFTLQEVYGDDEKLIALGESSLPPIEELPQANLSKPENIRLDESATYGSQFEFVDNAANATGFQSGKARIESARLERVDGAPLVVLAGGEKVRLLIEASTTVALSSPILGFFVKDRLGQELFGENTLPFTADGPMSVNAGDRFKAEFVFTLPMLPNGKYALTVSVAQGDLHSHVQHHWIHDIIIINVSSSVVRWGLVGIPFEHVSMEKC